MTVRCHPHVSPMQVHPECTLQLDASILAIGAFDGVHRGHQKLIASAVKSARTQGCDAVVYTFDTPPKAFFAGARVLTPVEEKLRRIALLGAQHTVCARFNRDYAARSTDDFMDELSRLAPREIWVGADFRFGAKSAGNVDLLATRFNVKVLDAVRCSAGQIISSTRIRELLQCDPASARSLLGHRRHARTLVA